MVPGADQRSPALPRADQQCQVLHVSPQHGPELMLRASQHFLVLPIPSRVCRGAPRLGMDFSAPPDPPAVLMAPRTDLEGSAVPTPLAHHRALGTEPQGRIRPWAFPGPQRAGRSSPMATQGGRGPAALAPRHVPTAAELATGPAPGSPLLVPPIRSRARLRVKETTPQPL